MRTKAKFTLVIILTLGTLLSCSKDDTHPIIEEEPSQIHDVQPSDIPLVMEKLNEELQLVKDDYSANSESLNSIVGKIKFDEILQVIDTLGNANYTFKVEDEDNNPFTFTNLIVKEWVDGYVQTPYLLHYKMDSSFIPQYISSGFSLEGFTGQISQELIGVDYVNNTGSNANLNAKYNANGSDPCPPITLGGGTSDGSSPTSGGIDPDFDYGSTDGTTCTLTVSARFYSCTKDDGAKFRPSTTCVVPILEVSCVTVASNGINDGIDCNNYDGDLAILDDDDALLRLMALEEYVANNPDFLIDLPCNQLPQWKAVAQHTPPQSVMNKLSQLEQDFKSFLTGDFDLQTLEEGKGKVVNMDYFPVTITTLPTGFTAESLYDHVRKNFMDLMDQDISEFSPYDQYSSYPYDENQNWISDNPLGTIMHIDIPFPAGDGSVICSDSQSNYWRFATITAPYDHLHPVSGTREFGYTRGLDGSFTYYTRGVDRITSSLSSIGALVANEFKTPDKLWGSFQDGIVSFVEQNGGSASKQAPVIARPNWNDIKEYLLGNKPLSELGCK